MFDAGRMLVFSSDFPHWDGDTPDFAARSFPRELRSRVMSETARELYGLPSQDPVPDRVATTPGAS
jgi:predicted TIM-barrel fold metal-dependent hydrolase